MKARWNTALDREIPKNYVTLAKYKLKHSSRSGPYSNSYVARSYTCMESEMRPKLSSKSAYM